MSDHSQVYAVKLEGQQMHNELYQTHTHMHTHKKILGNHNKKADSFIELLQIGRNGAMREALSWLICKEQYKTIFIKLNIDSMRRTVRIYEMRERSKTWFGSICSTKG